MTLPTPAPVNMERAERVAFADTKHLGRPRWSELSVFYLHEPTQEGKRWLALSVGMTSRQHEVPLTDQLCTFQLEHALGLFDDSSVGRQVKAQARDWAEHNATVATVPGPAPNGEAFTGGTDEEALTWLFGGDYSVRGAADAFDMNESTLRMALRNRTQVRIPVQIAARYFDRARFQSDMAAARRG